MSGNHKKHIVIVSAILITIALTLNFFELYPLVANGLMILSAFIAGYPIAKNAISELRYRILGIDVLVTVAVIGALFIREYWEAAAVTFLFIFGSYLEAKTLEKTRASIKSLLDLAPIQARVIRDGIEKMVSPDEVQEGEKVIVSPGEKIPVDGVVMKGDASVNQAAITGESIPVRKIVEDEVFSGTVIETGYVEVTAVKVGEDTTFSRILEMVEEAQDSKAPTQKFLERFSQYYTPGIMIFAVLVYLFTRDIELALTLLVIACPGALVISAPVSIVSGIGNGAKNGVLIKGGEHLEKASKANVVAFDKTGTLTVGKPKVTNIHSIQGNPDELLMDAARAELRSEHHLARAVINKAKERFGDSLKAAEEFTSVPGKGIDAIVNGRTIRIGKRSLMKEHGIIISNEIESYLQDQERNGQTAILISDHEKIRGVISIADVLREDVQAMVSQLKRTGVKKVIMLTGDNQRTAAAVAKQAGIDEFRAELMPEDKVAVLKEMQARGYHVAMVGDGINDAPALATADLGIAMGAAGTDVAMETADLVLMSDQLEKIPYSLSLSRATVRNMKQNIYFAVAVVFTLLLGVLTKNVFLASGMLVHELSVLVVILNAIRLIGFKSVKGND